MSNENEFLENKIKGNWKAISENDISYKHNLNEAENLLLKQKDRDYIETVKKQIEEDRLRNHYAKLNQIRNEQEDIKGYLEFKKMKEFEEIERKNKERSLTSLEFQNEAYLMENKEKKMKALEGIDYNIKKYEEFLLNSKKNGEKIKTSTEQQKTNDNEKGLYDSNSYMNENAKVVNNADWNNNYDLMNKNQIPSQEIDVYNQNFHRFQRTKRNQSMDRLMKHNNNILSNLSPTNPAITRKSGDYYNLNYPSNGQDIHGKSLEELQKDYEKDLNGYRKKQQLDSQFNFQNFTNNMLRYKEIADQEKRKKDEERMREIERIRNTELQLLNFKKNQQNYMKEILEYQISQKYLTPLPKPAKLIEDLVKNESHTFTYKNQAYTVNPYNNRSYNIGNTFLSHNPLVYPAPHYKYNRYLGTDINPSQSQGR